jgi:hypothetical protein
MNLTDTRFTCADLQKNTEPLGSYSLANTKVQADELPAEDPTVLLLELDQSLARLVTSISDINRREPQTQRPDGYLLINAIIQYEMLTLRQSMITSQIKALLIKAERYHQTANNYITLIARLHQEYNDLALQQGEIKEHEIMIPSNCA